MAPSVFVCDVMCVVFVPGSRSRVSSSVKHAAVAVAQPAGGGAAVAEPLIQSRAASQQSHAAVPPPAPPTQPSPQ